MKLYAKLVKIGKEIEEEIVLSFGEAELTCFASYAPNELCEGNVYLVELDLFFINDIVIEEANEKKLEIIQIGNGFKYEMHGFIHENQFIT